ncbi:hypothetical protein MSAN_02111900 [Mycena sanguinolenta]|uniref:Uncharacterized protein n=1 Tax=Mycena sanguinolenta TaxID=230812 RepID=A0A8H7CLV0_9AGAR|nr:hypothetical protein MSAN_02111900 [Mycena sanguinolenta]
MLEMTLRNFGDDFHKADIPFKACNIPQPAERSLLGKFLAHVNPVQTTPPQLLELDLPFSISSRRGEEASVSAGSVGVSFGGVGNHREKNSVKVQFVSRTGSKETPDQDDPAPLFNWEFFNSNGGPYPSMHTAIVLVSSKEATGQGAAKPFPFTLTLSGSF